jgi:hypothetical protein
VSDDELEDNAKEIAIDMARLAWETKVDDITVVDVAAQTSICRCSSHPVCSVVNLLRLHHSALVGFEFI